MRTHLLLVAVGLLTGCSVVDELTTADHGSVTATAASSATTSTAATTATAPLATTTTTTAVPVTTATSATTTTTTDDTVLQLALTVHVERHDTEVRDEAELQAHIAMLEQLADLAEQYGVVVNFELSTEFVEALDRWGSTFIEDMTARGHGIAQHSGDRSTDGLTGEARVDELDRQRAAIEAHGVEVTYVSGGCSADPGWVEDAIAAGFTAVTGTTEICLGSLDDEALPDGMDWIRSCRNPAVCHDPLHLTADRTLHPWTTSDSTDWLTDDPNGGLVIVSAAEVDGFAQMSKTGDADLAASLQQWQEQLQTFLDAVVPGQVNVWNFVLSIGPEPDWEVVAAIFADAAEHAAAGDVAWADLGDVVAAAAAEATTQPADATAVYVS